MVEYTRGEFAIQRTDHTTYADTITIDSQPGTPGVFLVMLDPGNNALCIGCVPLDAVEIVCAELLEAKARITGGRVANVSEPGRA